MSEESSEDSSRASSMLFFSMWRICPGYVLKVHYWWRTCLWLAFRKQFAGNAYLKIILLVKTPLHRCSMEVRCSGLWAPAIIEKIESARGTMGRGKRPSPFLSCLARSLFLSPSLPTTQRGLCRGERPLTKNFAKGSVCVCVLWEGGEVRGLVTYFGQEFFPRPTTLIQLDPLQ